MSSAVGPVCNDDGPLEGETALVDVDPHDSQERLSTQEK